ncbi:MAG TPA: DUF1634 domain-containing protein [Gemmataceae bacterium]|nr:DUF1634 domain-containing protein [Gemmataceae bacterium]
MSEQPRHSGPSDERVEGVIGNLLRIGVIASALVVLSGGILYLIHDGGQPEPDLHNFHEQPEQLRNPVHIVREAATLHPLGLIMLGLLLLIATPVARVIFSVASFVLQRDYLYVLFTLLVLSVLLYSLFSGYLTGQGAL